MLLPLSTLGDWRVRRGRNETGSLYLFLSFCVIVYSTKGRLIGGTNMNKKRWWGSLVVPVSYNSIAAFLHSKQVPVLRESLVARCCRYLCLHSRRRGMLPWCALELCLSRSGSTGIPRSGLLKVLHETGVARNVETHVVGVSSAHALAPLSKLKEKMIGNFKIMAAERWTERGVLLSVGLCAAAQVLHPWCWLWSWSFPPHPTATVLAEAFTIAPRRTATT